MTHYDVGVPCLPYSGWPGTEAGFLLYLSVCLFTLNNIGQGNSVPDVLSAKQNSYHLSNLSNEPTMFTYITYDSNTS